MSIPRSTANFPNDFYKPEIWSAMTLERWYAEGLIPQIANTNYEGEIKKYGQLVHIRRDPDAVISPYIVDTPLNYQAVIDEKTTLTIDYAFAAAHKVDSVDLAQMDINVVAKMSNAINKQMMMKENEVVFNALPTLSFNPANIVDKSGAAQTVGPQTDANYIVNGLVALRTAFNRRRMPKSGRFVVVSPEVEDLLLRCDHVRYDAVGRENKVIQDGAFNLRMAGFDILVSEFVPTSGSNVWLCPAGIKEAFTFARQLTEVEIGFTLPDQFGKGMKALNVFGFALTQPDGFGLWKVKTA